MTPNASSLSSSARALAMVSRAAVSKQTTRSDMEASPTASPICTASMTVTCQCDDENAAAGEMSRARLRPRFVARHFLHPQRQLLQAERLGQEQHVAGGRDALAQRLVGVARDADHADVGTLLAHQL